MLRATVKRFLRNVTRRLRWKCTPKFNVAKRHIRTHTETTNSGLKAATLATGQPRCHKLPVLTLIKPLDPTVEIDSIFDLEADPLFIEVSPQRHRQFM
jgi:hypothetical protein